ncbi:MAG: (2Fe-2S) ferredoxin domain-containing protein, partial [Spirochaetia bacterium]|nr:(2Fe-2S) ferredoxin domain-containing protein [Spirochaetia bacterium]
MQSYYEKHIFVCENIREEGKRVSCGRAGSKKLKDYLKLKTKELCPDKNIRINMSGCLDRCEEGPVMVSYPEGVWFSLKTESDIDLFVKEY